MDVDGCVEVRRYDRQQLLSAIKAVIRKRSEKSDACCKIYSFLQGCVANQSQSFVFQIQICVNKSEVSFFVGIITSSSLIVKNGRHDATLSHAIKFKCATIYYG